VPLAARVCPTRTCPYAELRSFAPEYPDRLFNLVFLLVLPFTLGSFVAKLPGVARLLGLDPIGVVLARR
jgi:hypothetical protein